MSPIQQLNQKLQHIDCTVQDALNRLMVDSKPFRVMPKWQNKITALSRQPNVAHFGSIHHFILEDGRHGYLLGCDVYGNIVIVQHATAPGTTYDVGLPFTTDYWGHVIGYESPLTVPFINRIVAAYGSICDPSPNNTQASQWFDICYQVDDLPKTFHA